MMHRKLAASIVALAGVFAMAFSSGASAQLLIQDDFTLASDTNNWRTFNGACLTAGDGTGNIPKCIGLPYYTETQVGGATGTLPDTAGNGALRFTNGAPGGFHQNGAIVSNFTFDTSAGLQITFKTVIYRGNSGGNGGSGNDSVFNLPINAHDGADGISFYLMDGSKDPGIGAWGGSLGYSCSNNNPPYDGLVGGYIGLGIDEYGNFLNPSDNTVTGPGLQADRIGLRGAGSISWQNLTSSYGSNPGSSTSPYYPSTLATTCNNAASTYSSSTHSCSPVCTSGTYVSSSNTCNSCGAGTYVSSSNTCDSCPSGTLNTSTGMCDNACAANTTFEANGQSPGSCYKCSNGTTHLRYNSSGNTYSCNNGGSLTIQSVSSIAATTAAPSTANPTTPSTYALLATQNTCRTGTLYNYSTPAAPTSAGTTSLTNTENTAKIQDYAAIPSAYTVLSGVQLANEAALIRGDAIPITYNLKITQDGLLSLSYSYNGGNYQPVISKQQIQASNGTLPASFRFGFAGSTGGSTNIHEILCFQASPSDLAATSIGVNEKEATKIASGTQAYLAYYFPTNWTGSVTASDLLYDSTLKTVSIASTANWDASCNLTGVASGKTCGTTTAAGPIAAQSPTSRTILTWSGSAGIPFRWSSLTTAEQNALDQGDASPINGNRLAYLRGDRTNEIYSDASGALHGLFRARDGVLADIIDSSPTWVGPPNSPYTAVWNDLIHGTATAHENSGTQSYTQYVTSAQTRLNVVYTGANDGLLHGFRSGSFDSGGAYVSTLNDGQEILAYMPGAALMSSIHGIVPNPSAPPATIVDPTLDYANSQYAHNFYVDATPDQDDLFYGGTWHTWLVGGMGPGGAALYALDVTDPSTFSEANASSVVIGEWTPATITCANVSSCGTNLGNTYGVPVIRRLHNGNWAVIFGNGFGSTSGDAGIYVMTVDWSTGVRTFYYLSTGSTGSNGIANVAPADLDGDHITDYVYAGDLLGHVWRFDLTSTNPSSWAVGSTPLFTVSSAQPITTKLLLAIVPQTSGSPRMMVDFGTGRKIPQNNASSAQYQSGSENLYGIWDWNMASWNTQAATANRFASLTAPQTVSNSTLASQTFTTPTTGVRDVTANAVCWAGSTTCGSGNTQFGWILPLPGTAEQVIFNPLLYQNAFVVNTTIPANNSPVSCAANTDTGYTIAVSVSTGGVLPGFFKNYNDTSAAGSQTNGTGTPFMVLAAGQTFLLTQSLGNGKPNGPILCPAGALWCSGPTAAVGPTGKRLTWIERR